MKNKNYFYFLFSIFLFSVFVLLRPNLKVEKEFVFALDCPIQTIGLSRETYNDLKSDPNIINEVKALQTIFSKIPNIGWQTSYKITGIFGYGTEALLRRFQKAYGLNSTGIIDEATRDKLCEIWEYQNRQITPQGAGGGTQTTPTTKSQITPQGAGGGTQTTPTTKSQTTSATSGGTTYTPQGTGAGVSGTCVYKVWSLDPHYCGSKPYCCVKYTTYRYSDNPCPSDMCQSDSDYTGKYLADPDFWKEFEKGIIGTDQSKFKVCKPKKCNSDGLCLPQFVGYVKKNENCPSDECSGESCSKDFKKCVYDDCILVGPQDNVYECRTVIKYVLKNENCPAGVDCKSYSSYSYNCENYKTGKHTCIVNKCENKNTPDGKCKPQKVETYDPCDTLKSECTIDNECKLVTKYKFDLDNCKCVEDQTNGTLTLSECELKKAEAIQKQQGGCKGKQPSDDWLKNIDCSLGNYSGSQPEFECEQKLGCKWCPECIYPSVQMKAGMYTGYPGGRCIKVNEPCEGKYTKGKCNAQCGDPWETVNPPACTTESYWGEKWREMNCDDPTTCEARCMYGQCQYAYKGFKDACASAKTLEQCRAMPSCTWVYECRGQQSDGPYRPTWYYVGPLQINTCTAWSIQMTENDYKCVKGKCGAECDDDSDCGPGNRCNMYCKCVSGGSCIGDSDLGDPLTYGECRNGFIKNPDDYVWKDRCDGPRLLIEATLTDESNCQCGYETIDCSKLLVNGICQDGKCVSATGGEKTYCGCKDFQKICATKSQGGGNTGEEIECRPGSEASCPPCTKSCLWYKCEKNTQGEYRCKQYYEEKVSKEKPCPQSDPSCKEGVIDKKCSPAVCSDFPGYSCESSNDCEENTSKGQLNCDSGKVCCKKKIVTQNYSHCEPVSYSISGTYYYTWTCAATSDSTKNDDCAIKPSSEWNNYCTSKYGNPKSNLGCLESIYGAGYGCFASNQCEDGSIVSGVKECESLSKVCCKGKAGADSCLNYLAQGYDCYLSSSCDPNATKGRLDCPSGKECCKLPTTLTGCLNNQPKVKVDETKCDYSNCGTTAFISPLIAYFRNLFQLGVATNYGVCKNYGEKEVCPEDIPKTHTCDGPVDCPCPTTTDKCSNYSSKGYSCVWGGEQNCEPGTNKGRLDCSQYEVCCKEKPPDKCSNYSSQGYSCLPYDQCSPYNNKGQLDCSPNQLCCKKPTSCSEFKDYYNYGCALPSDCEAGTSKGTLDCGSGKVCCQKKTSSGTSDKCDNYKSLGYSCVLGPQGQDCEPGTNKGQLDCPQYYVCCRMKTTATTSSGGQWCERCSSIKPCTKVKWYDSDGGCDDNWYNQRTESADDSCQNDSNAAHCPSGQTCKSGECVSSGSGGTTDKCENYRSQGYDCHLSSGCDNNYNKGKLNCGAGESCCIPANLLCSRCSSTKPCQHAQWYLSSALQAQGVTCKDDPTKYGIKVEYFADDTCQNEPNAAHCPSGQTCKSGECVSSGSGGTTDKCENYRSQGYDCHLSSGCDNNYNKGKLNCGAGESCCIPANLLCSRCSSTKPCQHAQWYLSSALQAQGVTCKDDPTKYGIKVEYFADDTCQNEPNAAHCPSGQTCKSGVCVSGSGGGGGGSAN